MPTTVVSLSAFKAKAAQRQALLMLKLMVQGEADIQAGRTTPQDQVFAEIKAGLTTPMDG